MGLGHLFQGDRSSGGNMRTAFGIVLCVICSSVVFLDCWAQRLCGERECKRGMVPAYFADLGECICVEEIRDESSQ